ncbi:uncharacterized protein [Pyrus communis]|uniref:uncharacterized protein n=1 Tax=Pyrus communis TaxID=23211 RepID=UPI0035BF1C4F
MANLAKLDFIALDIIGKNYFTWVVDIKIHLEVGNLAETNKEDNNASSQDWVKAMIFIRRYLGEGLKNEYLTIEDLLALWKALRNRYNHQKTVILPRAHYEWTHLRISSQMKLCGETITEEHMLEKTFSIFHASNMLMQQQYRARGFTEYNKLISVLLVAKQNNELLLKNQHSRPTGSAPFPEVNVVSLEANATSSGGNNHKRKRGHRRRWWNGKGKNHGVQFHNQVPRYNADPSLKNVNRHKGRAYMTNAPRNSEGVLHRCGRNGHWARTCRTPKHLVDLYQTSLKDKGVETNFLDHAKPMDIPDLVCDLSRQLNTTHLDVLDFIMEMGNEVYLSDKIVYV